MGNKIPFAFIDEVGVGLSEDQPLFGVGVFVVPDSLPLNRKIHDIFTGAVSYYKKDLTRFEFKFNLVTRNNLRFYQEILRVLEADSSWHFWAKLIKKDYKTWNSSDYWLRYLTILRALIEKGAVGEVILVADYLAKPALSEEDLSVLMRSEKIINILQLESQGSLLLQVTDILLGAAHFEERKKLLRVKMAKEAKVELVTQVDTLLDKAQEEGRVIVQK